MADEKLVFIEESEIVGPCDMPALAGWKTLIVDDDPSVHDVTKIALGDFAFRGRKIEFLDAYSAAEGIAKLAEHPDIAVMFLDVVMEDEHAGLTAVHRIREELGNRRVRIVLRTGQPGYAPEREAVLNYDINDYKTKSELTATKLVTCMVAALRSWIEMESMERSRRTLMLLLDAAGELDAGAQRAYLAGMHVQFASLLSLVDDELLICTADDAASGCGEAAILSAGGELVPYIGTPLAEADLPERLRERVARSLAQKASSVFGDAAVIYLPTTPQPCVLYLAVPRDFDAVESALAGIFCHKLLLARSNLAHLDMLAGDVEALALSLAQVAEPEALCSPDELQALGRLAAALAERLLADAPQRGLHLLPKQIAAAAMLHDYGNASLELRDWLIRPGPLEADEIAVVRQHPQAGKEALLRLALHAGAQSHLRLAAEIAAAHHECFDGSGYPLGLCGEAIPLAARIVAVADAFLAMTSARPWRAAMTAAAALDMIEAGAGGRFDPRVADALRDVLAAQTPH